MFHILVQISSHHTRKPPGWLVTSVPASYQFTGEADNHRLFARVHCPTLTQEDVDALFAPDIPVELRTASRDARQVLDDLIAKDRGDKAALMAASDAHLAAFSAEVAAVAARPRKWMFDHVALIPNSVRRDVAATWTKRNEVAVAARAAARARVDAVLERRLQRQLTQAEKSMRTSQFTEALATHWRLAMEAGADKATLGKIDEAIREIETESNAGWMSVERPALALLAVPAVVPVTRSGLDAATIAVPR